MKTINSKYNQNAKKLRDSGFCDLCALENNGLNNENLACQSENMLSQSENTLSQCGNMVSQSENKLIQNENMFIQSENMLIQSENMLIQSENRVVERENMAGSDENIQLMPLSLFTSLDLLFAIIKHNINAAFGIIYNYTDKYLHYSNSIIFYITNAYVAVSQILRVAADAVITKQFISTDSSFSKRKYLFPEFRDDHKTFDGVIERYCGVPP